MTALHKTLMSTTLAVALLGLFAGGLRAAAPPYRHMDELAFRLQREAGILHEELHAHFRNTPQFRHLDHDVREMEELAAHIHEVAHERGDIRHLRADVQKLDRLFHHVEDLVREMQYSRAARNRGLSHIRAALRQMGDTLHHLKWDLGHVSHGHDH